MFQMRFGLLLGGRIGRLYQVRQWELLQRKFRCLRAVPLRALERFRAGGRVHTLRQGKVLPGHAYPYAPDGHLFLQSYIAFL